MIWRDRSGQTVPGDAGQDRLLERMYGTAPGRCLVRLMIRPRVSRAAGWLLDRRISALAVGPFIRRNHICMDDFEQRKFRSFNDFFTRKIREGRRPVDETPSHLIAPCDSKLTVRPIEADSRFTVKGTEYTLAELLRSGELAERFLGGTLLLFRLTVGDYHRYCYIDTGFVGENVLLPGVFHTVNPAAASRYPIYKENTRTFSLLQSEHFGAVLQMEVGAAMVGRIVNEPGRRHVTRGQEKGRFEFGGSTVIVLLQKDAAILDEDLLRNTRENAETVVRLGMRIGEAKGCDSK